MPALIALVAIVFLFVFEGCASSKEEGKPSVVSSPSALPGERKAISGEIAPYSGAGKTLVVYFSQGEATEWLAEDLAEIFGADIEEIEEIKPRMANFIGFMFAGFQSTFKLSSGIKEPRFDPAGYDRVFVLTPVWSWGLAPPVRAWLKRHKGGLPRSAFATVSGDTKPDKIVATMAKVSGSSPTAFAGFGEADFKPEGRASYVAKLSGLADTMR
jgi:hypothetical protein